jgi:hypothetical protein
MSIDPTKNFRMLLPCSILMGVPQFLIGVLLGFFLVARRRMKQKSGLDEQKSNLDRG